MLEIPIKKHVGSQFYIPCLDSLFNILNSLKYVICIDSRGNEVKTRIEKVYIEAYKVWVKLSTNANCVKLILPLKIED